MAFGRNAPRKTEISETSTVGIFSFLAHKSAHFDEAFWLKDPYQSFSCAVRAFSLRRTHSRKWPQCGGGAVGVVQGSKLAAHLKC